METGGTKERKERKERTAGDGAYRAPALDRGLDLLEVLAAAGTPMTQAQVARTLGIGAGGLFRTLATLERRGYLYRDPESGAYSLTLRLAELGHLHSPFDQLRRAAAGPMLRLTGQAREGCHLSVVSRGRLLVLHQEESPARVRLSVEVGSTIDLADAASGRVLLALGDGVGDGVPAGQRARLDHIRTTGYEAARSESVPGVTDLSVPVGSPVARAALAITALTADHDAFVADHLPLLQACAREIAHRAGLGGGGST